MKYAGNEHKILRLLKKFSEDGLTVKERFSTNGSIDIEKVKNVYISQGMSALDAFMAFTFLVGSGYSNFVGVITASGLQKLIDIEIARAADIARLGLTEFFATGFGTPSPEAITELASIEY